MQNCFPYPHGTDLGMSGDEAFNLNSSIILIQSTSVPVQCRRWSQTTLMSCQSEIYISLMRALTRTVLRPWKQHGGHLLPLLGPQRGQNKESQHSEDWSYGKAATFISNSHLPMMASCDSNPTNKHLIQVDPNLLLLDISSFFFSFLFFFFTCFREKNKKQQRDCFTHWLATM